MDNDLLYKTVRATRFYMLQHVEDLSHEQLLKVPEKAGHSILWNIGHIIDSEGRLLYGNSGAEPPVPASYTDLFKGGTSPKDWKDTPSIDEILGHLRESCDRNYTAYKDGKFAGFKPFELIKGYSLDSVEDVFAFNIFHESVHIGMIMELRKLVGAGKK